MCLSPSSIIWHKHQDNNIVTWRPAETVQSSYVSAATSNINPKKVDEKIKRQQALHGYMDNIHETGLHMIEIKFMVFYSNGFEVKVGMHQSSALSPLLFVMVMEALSREFRVA